MRFTGVRVPVANTLGGEGEAFRLAQKRLGPGRIHHVMRWLGQMQRAFELMCRYANEREAFGGPLAREADGAELGRRLRGRDPGVPAPDDGRGAEDRRGLRGAGRGVAPQVLRGATSLVEVIDRAIQVHGARGLTDETPLAQMALHARAARIYDGPDEVHRMVVARQILRVVPRRATAGRSPRPLRA